MSKKQLEEINVLERYIQFSEAKLSTLRRKRSLDLKLIIEEKKILKKNRHSLRKLNKSLYAGE